MLLEDSIGRQLSVDGEAVLGRSPRADFQVEQPVVSARHAVVGYGTGEWQLRDLGSKNGTWVRGRRLEAGEWFSLREGDSIRLGRSASPLLVRDLGVPPLLVVSQDGVSRGAVDGVIALPSEEEPEYLLMNSPAGFVMERGGERSALSSGQVIECEGKSWTVRFPSSVAVDTEQMVESLSLREARAVFEVSADEEHVCFTLTEGETRIEIPSRSFCGPLRILAEARLQDMQDGLPPAECGWRNRRELIERLSASAEKLNLDLHRARRALVAQGVTHVDRLIERRLEAGLLRIGISELSVERSAEAAGGSFDRTMTVPPKSGN